ncbi:MAG: hypothetical protein JWQ14_1878 [Adhaeribacter sp.]|nr:hypothetical protein [Adhaeribacter sp.]
MFIKKVFSLIMIFLIGFSTQVQEKEIYNKDFFYALKIQSDADVAREACEIPLNLD